VGETERQRWDRRYREGGGATEPSAFLLSLDGLLPRRGRALDLAGGRGRHALWLAARGLKVTLADVSPVGLALAREAAEERRLPIRTVEVDLAAEPPPAGPWDVLVCFHYLHRPLFRHFPALLAPEGLLVFCQPTRRNLERHLRPSERHLLAEGELPRLVTGLLVLSYEEGWTEEGRHEARLVAGRPHPPGP
jgi:tellurite methyltransferase